MLRISNYTACRFAEKTRSCRSRWAGRALCPPPRRLPFHRQNASIPLPLFFPTTRAPHFFIWGALTSLWNIFDAKDCFPPKKCCVPANVKPYSLAFRGKTCSFRPRRAGRRCAAASPFAFFKGKLF